MLVARSCRSRSRYHWPTCRFRQSLLVHRPSQDYSLIADGGIDGGSVFHAVTLPIYIAHAYVVIKEVDKIALFFLSGHWHLDCMPVKEEHGGF